jgi:quinol monooxygenase YgiN
MYGTIARLKVRAGTQEQLKQTLAAMETRNVPGFVASYLYRTDEDPNVLMLAVLFTDRDAYTRNADSPDQDRQFQAMRGFLASDPEWYDGEIIWSYKAP